MRFNKTAIKSIAAALMLGQLNMALQPLYAATRDDKGASSPMVLSQIERMQALQRSIDEGKPRKAQENLSPADQASQRLARVEELVRDIAYHGEQRQVPVGTNKKDQVRAIGPNLKARVAPLTAEQKAQRHDRRQALMLELKGLLSQQAQDQAVVRAEFAQTRQRLLDRKLPAEILARHDAAVAKFEQRAAQFNQSSAKARQGEEQALAELQGFFDQNPTKRKAAPVDPKNLPWRTQEPTKRLPAETQTAWFQNLYGNKGTRLAQVGNSLEGLEFVTQPEPGVAPTAADLAETPETQRTAAIKAKALELGNNPVNIQNWVRNNVEWVPTWGGIQSAQDTLDKKRGNAIDIASLEIALLRAAKIPARYQFGTIELPAEQVMNWVGGVTKPEAAQQLLGQGGIANRGLVEGGRISKIRMEHAWVQAYVNWLPSRGAKQGGVTQHPSPMAQRNAWVPMDGSLKKYEYSNKFKPREAVPTSLDVLATDYFQEEVDAWGSAVRKADDTAFRNRASTYSSQLQSYASTMKVVDVTGRKVAETALSQMTEASPYTIVQAGAALPELPRALVHKFSYTLYLSAWEAEADSPLLVYEESLPRLSGRDLVLTYEPATKADMDVIASYLPSGKPVDQVKPEDFPSDFPGYLVKMVPVLSLDSVVVARASGALTMGTDLYAKGGFTRLDALGQWDLTVDESNCVGNVTSIGISATGVSRAQVARANTKLQAAADAIGNGTQQQIKLNELGSSMISAPMLGWFAAAEGHGHLSQHAMGSVEHAGLSYGLFHVYAKPIYSWGIAKKVAYSSVGFDIGHFRSIAWARNGDRSEWVGYNRYRGQYMSMLEHAVLEKFFEPRTCEPTVPCLQGVSAVKALAVAGAERQRLYAITQSIYQSQPNIVDVKLGALSVSTRNAIKNYLSAGYEVYTHERPIQVGGWTGAGYIFIDPDTGAGGYIIDGGARGGELDLAASGLAAIAKIAMGIFITSTLASLLAPVGITLLLPAISMYVLFFALITALVVGYMAHWYASPDEAYEDNKRFIDAMTFLPSFGSKGGILWMMVQQMWTVTR